MSHSKSEYENIINNMKYNMNDFFKNPHNSFDSPPPNFNVTEEIGWPMLAKAIVTNDSGLYR